VQNREISRRLLFNGTWSPGAADARQNASTCKFDGRAALPSPPAPELTTKYAVAWLRSEAGGGSHRDKVVIVHVADVVRMQCDERLRAP
jgi:hypothetical protein